MKTLKELIDESHKLIMNKWLYNKENKVAFFVGLEVEIELLFELAITHLEPNDGLLKEIETAKNIIN